MRLEVVRQFLERLESADIEYCIGGSVAAMVHGHARFTRDLDLLLQIDRDGVNRLHLALGKDYLFELESALEAVELREPFGSFQVLDDEDTFKFDCFVSTGDEYSRIELERKVRMPVLSGLLAWCATPEDIVLRKLQWFELGNRVSDRQWNDVVGVLEVQKGRLDEGYLDEWATKLEVKELLEKARSQVKPI